MAAENVARFLLGVLRKAPELAVEERDVNGELGLVVSVGDQTVGTVSLGTVSPDTVSPGAVSPGTVSPGAGEAASTTSGS